MNAPAILTPSLSDAHRAAVSEVNQWRGHCIDHFARIESIMMRATSTILERPECVQFEKPSLFGKHLQTLKNASAQDWIFAVQGKRLRETLVRFEQSVEWRNRLVHGFGQVFFDVDGNWIWNLEYTPARGDTERHLVLSSAANALRHELKSSCQSLESGIADFLKRLELP